MSPNFRVIASFINQGEDIVYRIEDVNPRGGTRMDVSSPLLVDHFIGHTPPLPSARSVGELHIQLRAMLAACDKPVLHVRTQPETLEEWGGR